MENNKKSVFETLSKINVNGMTEKKNGLTYLSWASAIEVALKHFPDLEYEIERNPETGLPYWYDPNTGYMVFVKVTINQQTREMWLPVLDSSNHTMKAEPYVVVTKYKKYTVPAASMGDINRSLMRAIVKCLSLFGLGLYIYRGEDVPSTDSADSATMRPAQPANKPIEKAAPAAQPAQAKPQAPVKDTRPATKQMIDIITDAIKDRGVTEQFICDKYQVSKLEDLKVYQTKHIGKNLDKLTKMFDNEKRENLADIQPQEKTEEIDLQSLGLTEADLNILSEAGNVFN